jgi:hypothetical protein
MLPQRQKKSRTLMRLFFETVVVGPVEGLPADDLAPSASGSIPDGSTLDAAKVITFGV